MTNHSSAAICHENGWKVGDVLEGDEGFGPERIEITAIGVERVLARPVADPRFATAHAGEVPMDLMARAWAKVAAPAARPPALLCSKCHKPIRKGQSCLLTIFARHAGVVDGQQATAPWLSVIVHLREECMGSLTPEAVREARKARLRPVVKGRT